MPDFFMSGMVTTPTASALAAAMPEMLPKRLDATTEILAARRGIGPHQAEREVVEEARTAGAREELAHQHEGHHDGAGDLEHQAEQAVVVEAEIDRRAFVPGPCASAAARGRDAR